MDPMTTLAVLVGAAAALLVRAWLRADRRDAGRTPGRRPGHRIAPRRAAAGNAACSPAVRARRQPPSRPRPVPPPRLPDSVVLAGPPLVAGGATLRDWLVHFHPERRNVWADVAAEFFTALADRPDIADYFAGSDRDAVQKHFLGAVITLTGSGVTVGTLEVIRSRHGAVRNSQGHGITQEVFDDAMGLLMDILAAKQVPGSALAQLEAILGVLRIAVVDPGSAALVSGRHARVDPVPAWVPARLATRSAGARTPAPERLPEGAARG
jgi:hypothetical protein